MVERFGRFVVVRVTTKSGSGGFDKLTQQIISVITIKVKGFTVGRLADRYRASCALQHNSAATVHTVATDLLIERLG